jgi:hypothetical protein
MMNACLSRRGVLAGGLAVVAARAAIAGGIPEAPMPDTLKFKVMRNGSEIGTHTLSFSRSAGTLRVMIEAEFRVGFGPIRLFHYSHRGLEQWRDGQFQSLATETNDNGTRRQVRAVRGPDGILIKATGEPDVMAPSGALPLTHWAVAAMHAKLFNPETGKLLQETARPAGVGTVTLVDGTAIPVTGYALAGEAPIKDWYDSSNTWAALDALARDGSRIAYRRI